MWNEKNRTEVGFEQFNSENIWEIKVKFLEFGSKQIFHKSKVKLPFLMMSLVNGSFSYFFCSLYGIFEKNYFIIFFGAFKRVLLDWFKSHFYIQGMCDLRLTWI